MTNLATAGAMIGGGAAVGVGVVAAAPVIAVNLALHKILPDSDTLPRGERDARKAARVGGAVGGVAAVGVAGSTLVGLSGAAMAAELAAVGGTVGLGMAGGAAMLIAAPAVVALGVAAGGYGLVKAVDAHAEAAVSAKIALQTAANCKVLKVISTNQAALGRSLELLGDGMPFIEMPTLGGKVFWTDMAEANGWKLQRNDIFGNCRIIDASPAERGKAWGQTAVMTAALSVLAKEIDAGKWAKKG